MSTLSDPHSDDEKRAAMARALGHGGFDDVLVLERTDAETVLTEKRRELLAHLKDHDVESVRALARALDRDKASVSRDLSLLAEYDVVTFASNGAARSPRLKHETVVVEPVV